MSMTVRKAGEQLMDAIGDVNEQYIYEYMEALDGATRLRRKGGRPGKLKYTVVLAAVMILLLGTVSVAAVSMIGHFLANSAREREAVLKNFSEIQEDYALPIGTVQEYNGVTATLNSAVLEDHSLLLSYTFDWSGLEGAQDGSFHTWFLPWFFYITEGDTVICHSEYTQGLHTQTLPGEAENEFSDTFLYCISLGETEGRSLAGRELSVQLLYAEDSGGFSSSFTPKACFENREWQPDTTFEFQGHEITLHSVRESALYVTLFMDCDAIGRAEDEYMFVLSDELGNDYTVYPYETADSEFWFVKPESMGRQLTLRIVRSGLTSDRYGEITDDSYEILYELPVNLK